MNQWFGEPWPRADYRAPICEDDRFRIPTPVGEPCMHCGELVAEEDQGTAFPGSITATGAFDPTPLYAHIECQIRSVRGCPAMLRGEPCGPHCHTGSYREGARQVMDLLRRHPSL